MGPTIVFRPTSSRVYAVLTWVVATVILSAFAANGGPGEVLRYGAVPLVLAALGWSVFWQPRVVVGDDGVEVVNVLRTVEVPWAAVVDVETRWGLRLVTDGGSVNAWAAPAKAGFGRRRSVRRAEELPDVLFDEGSTATLRRGGDAEAVARVVEARLGQSRSRSGVAGPAGGRAAAPAAGRTGGAGADAVGPRPRARWNTREVVLVAGSLALAALSVALA